MNEAKLVHLSDLINSKKIRRIGVTPYFISKDERLSFLLYLKENRNLIFDFGGCPRSFEKDIFSYLRRNLNDYFGSYRLKGEDIFSIFEDVVKKNPEKVKIWMMQSNDSEYYQIFFPLQQRYELDNFSSESEVHKLIWVSSREFLIRKNISIPIFTKFWRSEMIFFLSSFFPPKDSESSPTDIGDILSSIPTDVDSSHLEPPPSLAVENIEVQTGYPLPSDFQGLTPQSPPYIEHLRPEPLPEKRFDLPSPFEKRGGKFISRVKLNHHLNSQHPLRVDFSPLRADFSHLKAEISSRAHPSLYSSGSHFPPRAQNILDESNLSFNKKLFSRYFVNPGIPNPYSEQYSLFSRPPEYFLGLVDSSYFSNPFF